jgi:hypothetical protein
VTTILESFFETTDAIGPSAAPRRSWQAVASGASILMAPPLTILTALVFGGGDSVVTHALLGMGMIFLFLATADFAIPQAITWLGRAGMAGLGGIFLIQGVADAVQWAPLLTVAYGDPTIQLIEKVSAYPILVWFVGLLVWDSEGKSRIFGGLVLGSIVLSELYSLWLVLNDGSPDIILRAFYLGLFVWLAVEGLKRRPGRR